MFPLRNDCNCQKQVNADKNWMNLKYNVNIMKRYNLINYMKSHIKLLLKEYYNNIHVPSFPTNSREQIDDLC